jgi:hypothetical protein
VADLALDVISNEARHEPGMSENDLRVFWMEAEDMVAAECAGTRVGDGGREDGVEKRFRAMERRQGRARTRVNSAASTRQDRASSARVIV